MTNPILQYWQAICDGTETVGYWIHLFYRYVVKGLESGKFTYNAKKANKAIRFIENFCHHCEGRDDLLILELWQKALVAVIFGVEDAFGLRQFREVFVVVARKTARAYWPQQSLHTASSVTANTVPKSIAWLQNWRRQI